MDLVNGNIALDPFLKLLEDPAPAANVIPLSKVALDTVSFHDFAFYQFLMRTDVGYGQAPTPSQGLSAEALAYLDELEAAGAPQEMLNLLANFLSALETAIHIAAAQVVANAFWPEDEDQAIADLYGAFRWFITELFQVYELAGPLRDAVIADFTRRLVKSMHLLGGDNFWEGWSQFAADFLTVWRKLIAQDDRRVASYDYPFEVFPSLTVNVGLRLIYRQDWDLLARQKGEVVRTIALGPGQKQRMGITTSRRRKSTSTLEQITETERTTETSDSTKDSTEIVNEAASTFNWKVDAEVHGGISLIGGSVHGSVGGTSSNQNTSTNSSLSEAMQKTSSKLRRETKVAVSTETEETFETESAFELVNSNNEMAVTYEFYKLQQQYQVFTYLEEVQAVIFVAEVLPSPVEIGAEWVRRYDWIISKVLKDESLRETLNGLIQSLPENDPVAGVNDPSGQAYNPFQSMSVEAQKAFASFSQNGSMGNAPNQGLTIPDIYAEPQRIYEQYLRDAAVRDQANELMRIKQYRLFQHIADNILYYCQAIWTHEDSDQRILRYKKEGRQVLIEWQAPIQVVTPGAPSQGLGAFTPTGKTAPLWELIDPTGPVGYVGNYAVFPLRPLPQTDLGEATTGIKAIFGRGYITLTLDQILAEMRRPYVGPDGLLLDPAFAVAQTQAAAMSDQQRKKITDAQVADVLRYVPELTSDLVGYNGKTLRDGNGELQYQITADQWARYLYLKDATRQFLVDTNNLYLSLSIDEGAALEPFKRAHRYLDVLKAAEEIGTIDLQNKRRAVQINQVGEYDPDVSKVVIVGNQGGSGSVLAAVEAATDKAPRITESSHTPTATSTEHNEEAVVEPSAAGG